KLRDLYGAAALRNAIREALERNTPRASSVAFLLRRQLRSTSPRLAVDLSRHPEAQSIDVRPHDLETYDELARNRDDDPDEARVATARSGVFLAPAVYRGRLGAAPHQRPVVAASALETPV